MRAARSRPNPQAPGGTWSAPRPANITSPPRLAATLRCEVTMPDDLSDADDAIRFQEACEAVRASAAHIAGGGTFGEPPGPAPGRPSLFGKVIGRLFAPQIRALMKEAVATSPFLSRLHPRPP